MNEFELCGPLPAGVTLLEASAGTGKTFTIAALVTRYVAEGIPLDRLLVVTFTRMATGELRERVRERLLSAAEGVGRAVAGAPLPAGDDIVALLATGTPQEVALRHERLAAAVAGFDAATIETTHGFCLRVLTGLGVAGEIEPGTALEPDIADMVDEVVDDLYVRRFWRQDVGPRFTRNVALKVGREVTAHADAALAPARSESKETWAMRRRLADAVRDELEHRKRAAKVLTYDDVLLRLRDALRSPAACARLRARYQVALIDEFQDTDLVQWEIVRSAFGTGETTLVLIGDPKQAIYAFRGADVHAYLRAAQAATTRSTLGTNWRSDQGLLDAYDALLGGTQLGEEGIAYHSVRAARQGTTEMANPLRFRIVRRDSGVVKLTNKGFVATAEGRTFVAEDVAVDISRLLASGTTIPTALATPEPVRPGHVAVLVRTNKQAELVRAALNTAGIPAVVGGSASVFREDAAGEWRRLLDALEQPTSSSAAASVALTDFVGWSAEQVANAGPATWEDLHWRLHRWAAILNRRGVAALLETISASQRVPGRVLARPDGERRLSDLRHIGELLHAAATDGELGGASLGAWLRRRIAEARAVDTTDIEDRARRLESDADAVQVLTVHRAKGLEFPIVYCPYLWDESTWDRDEAIPVFHDPDAGGARTIDVGGKDGPDYDVHRRLATSEERGEQLRLLYVALTRARHQAVVWWAGSMESHNSPLGRILFVRGADGVIDSQGRGVPDDGDVAARIAELTGIAAEDATGGAAVDWQPPPDKSRHLEAAVFDRALDQRWSRTSYTAITSVAHAPVVGSEPETEAVTDEPATPLTPLTPTPLTPTPLTPTPPTPAPTEDHEPLLLASMPAGAAVGIVIHRLLERTDFSDTSGLDALVTRQLQRDTTDLGDRDLLVAGLNGVINAPLGPLAGGRALRDFTRADRLDELGFELPLAGGDHPTGELTVADIAALLSGHIPPGDPLADYPQRLLGDETRARILRGYLTGSLDVVLRVDDRYLICDYKTNRLAAWGEPLTAWHYRPDALAAAMQEAHYPLQAILYTVALHRYLRWRLPDYDPAINLGGVLYLFVRGMSGAVDGDEARGVFSWQPPAALVEALSDLFDSGRLPA